MDEGIDYYIKKMNSNKKTGYLFGVLPFKFRLEKNEATFIFALIFFLFGILTNTLIISILIFFLVATEYNRVFDFREKILDESIMNEEMFKIIIREEGIDPNFPNDPLYVTEDDYEEFICEALYLNRSYNIFKKIYLFALTRKIHRG